MSFEVDAMAYCYWLPRIRYCRHTYLKLIVVVNMVTNDNTLWSSCRVCDSDLDKWPSRSLKFIGNCAVNRRPHLTSSPYHSLFLNSSHSPTLKPCQPLPSTHFSFSVFCFTYAPTYGGRSQDLQNKILHSKGSFTPYAVRCAAASLRTFFSVDLFSVDLFSEHPLRYVARGTATQGTRPIWTNHNTDELAAVAREANH